MNRVLFGDSRETLPELAAQGVRVQCVVTSPPYWGLRSYLPKDHPLKPLEIGSEPRLDCLGWATGSPCGECFICHLVAVFREVRGVLADDGVCWINMGDSYHTAAGAVGSSPGGGDQGERFKSFGQGAPANRIAQPGLKAKDMCAQPWRLGLALQADGWYLRQDIIWHKRNPMPESITDRCTKAHEYVLLLARSERYFYDAEAIKEAASPDAHARSARGRSAENKYTGADGPHGNPNTLAMSTAHMILTSPEDEDPNVEIPIPSGWDTSRGEGGHGSHHRHGRRNQEIIEGGHGTRPRPRKGVPNVPGVNPKSAEDGSGVKANTSFSAALVDVVGTRNKRSVWTLTNQGYSGAHFATFPESLVEPCILAATSAAGHCPRCGKRWRRVTGDPISAAGRGSGNKARKLPEERGCPVGEGVQAGRNQCSSVPWSPTVTPTTGWAPTCGCGCDAVPDVVLDPFMGSGTVAQVAQRLGRSWVGCELNEENYLLQRERTVQLGLALMG